MSIGQIKDIKRQAKILMKNSTTYGYDLIYSVMRLLFIYAGYIIFTQLLNNYRNESNGSIYFLEGLVLITIIFIAYFNAKLTFNHWMSYNKQHSNVDQQINLTDSQIKASNIASTFNGIIKIGYLYISGILSVFIFMIIFMIMKLKFNQFKELNYLTPSLIWLFSICAICTWLVIKFVNQLYAFMNIINYENESLNKINNKSRGDSRHYVLKHYKAYLKLSLSLLPWHILNICTFGLLSIYLTRYYIAIKIIFRKEVQ